ncbi:MAG: tRNA 2-thiouridine(34) synthase MnmA [Solirubrobacterales bacterium]
MSQLKVMVAMSGGVDSSAAALLLKRQGYAVTGITMQIWPRPDEDSKSCCSLSAVDDARRVAWKLEIPHYVMNFRDEFADRVIRLFCEEYQRGRTPNPCVACNRWIKFSSLLAKARAMGMDYLATGHYAQIRAAGDSSFELWRGIVPAKDQSYFLFQMGQEELRHTLFPLGTYTKPEIREIAREAGLSVADKHDSQEICFVESGRYSDFVESFAGDTPPPGSFRDRSGRVLGTHQGIHRYTIGQRKGLGIALGHPVFVTGIDPETNTVVLGESDELMHNSLIAEDACYVSGEPFSEPVRVSAKIRSAAPPAGAIAQSLSSGLLRVDFDKPQRAITPGQAVVLYDGDRVLGGGTIARVPPSDAGVGNPLDTR